MSNEVKKIMCKILWSEPNLVHILFLNSYTPWWMYGMSYLKLFSHNRFANFYLSAFHILSCVFHKADSFKIFKKSAWVCWHEIVNLY
jgi:hypothetical protein